MNIFKDECLPEINKIIETYSKLSIDYTRVDKIIYMSQKLTGHSYYIARQTANAAWDFKNAEARHEIERTKGYLRAKSENENISDTGAVNEARAKALDSKEKAMLAEGIYLYYKTLLTSIYEVLARMNQHIAYLRKELENAPRQQG